MELHLQEERESIKALPSCNVLVASDQEIETLQLAELRQVTGEAQRHQETALLRLKFKLLFSYFTMLLWTPVLSYLKQQIYILTGLDVMKLANLDNNLLCKASFSNIHS